MQETPSPACHRSALAGHPTDPSSPRPPRSLPPLRTTPPFDPSAPSAFNPSPAHHRLCAHKTVAARAPSQKSQHFFYPLPHKHLHPSKHPLTDHPCAHRSCPPPCIRRHPFPVPPQRHKDPNPCACSPSNTSLPNNRPSVAQASRLCNLNRSLPSPPPGFRGRCPRPHGRRGLSPPPLHLFPLPLVASPQWPVPPPLPIAHCLLPIASQRS